MSDETFIYVKAARDCSWAEWERKHPPVDLRRVPGWTLSAKQREALEPPKSTMAAAKQKRGGDEAQVATSRDRYGWRSLPSGSGFLGAPGTKRRAS